MNILPKKRWHVRTKENIARVRKDEALAAEAEKERLNKIALAEREARIGILRRKAGASSNLPIESRDEHQSPSHAELEGAQHVNLFEDLETGIQHSKKENVEYLKEKKEEKEKYEKQIGYLTYLGQDTNEALKLRSWYELPPDRSDARLSKKDEEKYYKSKFYNDPLNVINLHLSKTATASERVSAKGNLPPYTPAVTVPTVADPDVSISSKIKKKNSKKDKRHKHKKKADRHKHKKHKREGTKMEEERETKLEKLKILRAERLKREAAEKLRQEQILSKHRGDDPKKVEKSNDIPEKPRIKQKYNSQFNPELAKQNYESY